MVWFLETKRIAAAERETKKTIYRSASVLILSSVISVIYAIWAWSETRRRK